MQHKRGYIPEFDGMRGIAILMVMLFHIWRYKGDAILGKAISGVAYTGWSGVDVFFVLSGFLITGILLDTRNSDRYWRDFYIRRSLRIFPLYYAVMTCVVVGGLVIKNMGLNLEDAALQAIDNSWLNYLYVTNFIKAFFPPDYVPLDIAWSLAVEEQFYLVFPFVVRYTDNKTLKYSLIAAILSAPLFRYLTFISADAFEAPRHMGPYVLPYCRMDSLAIGGLAVLIVREASDGFVKRLSQATFPMLALSAVVLSLWGRSDVEFVIFGYSVLAIASMTLMLRVFTGNGPIFSKIFCNPILVYIGKISYGLYLLHLIARIAVDQFVLRGLASKINQSTGLAIGRFLLIAAVSIVMASISYFAFERPILRLKDKFAPVKETISRPE